MNFIIFIVLLGERECFWMRWKNCLEGIVYSFKVVFCIFCSGVVFIINGVEFMCKFLNF